MLQLIVFAVVSVGIVFFSWTSLRDPHTHGFFRFFAVESILALLLLNGEHWFREPFSAPQIVSWLLLLASLFLVVHGFYLLRLLGRPKGKIEDTTTLVTVGAYRYIRHPLYASLLFLGWGAFFKQPSLLGGALVLATTAFLVATARVEEAENRRKFGADYATYMKTTKMFIPFLF
jgi:protein-S-isoprenylcysteine O-methyltransferase Ste14